MPLDRDHAFADGPAFGRPKRGRRLKGAAARSAEAWTRFESEAVIDATCLLGPNSWCVNSSGERSRITLDAGAICRGLLRVEKFGAGAIRIRSKAYVGDDCLLSSSVGIDIGEQVLIAHGVQIFDNDSHPLESSARAGDFAAVLTHGARGVIAAAPVRIERRAWIGFHAIILKGVTVGENSVIAAGSVVTQDIPANSVAAGNPARVIKSLLPADV